MRNALPFLIILLAAACGYWLLATDPGGPGADPLDESALEPGGRPVVPGAASLEAKGAPPTKGGGEPTRAPATMPDPRTLPKGSLVVRVRGDHIVGKTVLAEVVRDREATVDVEVERAGAIRYDVIAYDKTRPMPVKLTLFDWQDQPVEAWYQERTNRRLTTPKPYRTAEIGPEGVIFGLLPGTYRLHVLSPNEEWDEAKVEVAAGQTVAVSLEVRR